MYRTLGGKGRASFPVKQFRSAMTTAVRTHALFAQVQALLAHAPEMARPDALIVAVGTKIYMPNDEVCACMRFLVVRL